MEQARGRFLQTKVGGCPSAGCGRHQTYPPPPPHQLVISTNEYNKLLHIPTAEYVSLSLSPPRIFLTPSFPTRTRLALEQLAQLKVYEVGILRNLPPPPSPLSNLPPIPQACQPFRMDASEVHERMLEAEGKCKEAVSSCKALEEKLLVSARENNRLRATIEEIKVGE